MAKNFFTAVKKTAAKVMNISDRATFSRFNQQSPVDAALA
jgi:hypothetical protein